MSDHKKVLITGASSGIGKACALAFANLGADLILTARRQEKLKELESQIRLLYPKLKIFILVMDITDFSLVQEKIATLPKEWQEIDILINNAGLAKGTHKFHLAPKDSRHSWQKVIDTNVKGLMNITAEVCPYMIQNKSGHIINIGSIAGRYAYPGGAVYCASKAAVRLFSDGLRMDLVDTPIRVSNIEPGLVQTDFSLVRFDGDQERADAVYEKIEALTSKDIAEIAVFMATRPKHVQISDMVVTPTHQASANVVHYNL